MTSTKPPRGRLRRALAWSAALALALLAVAGVLFRLRPLAAFELLGRAGLRASGFRARQVARPAAR